MAESYPPPYEYRFVAGPYVLPKVRSGQVVHDERLGDVTVDGFMNAPIPWPATTYRTKLVPILFHGLVRAVVEESAGTVAHYWGVTRHQVNQWRRALAGAESLPHARARLALLRQEARFREKYGY